MKIAIDCRLWLQGGVGRYVRNLVWQLEQLDRHNQYTLFFYQQAPVNLKPRFQIRLTQAKWHSVAEQWQFNQELKQGNFDLVHFPYFSHPLGYNRPFVITVHDLTVKHLATGKATTRLFPTYLLKRWGYQLVLRHGLRQAGQILVPSQAVKADILKHFPETKNKLTVTYEGLGQDLLRAKPKMVKLSAQRFWLYVGNFYPHKNVPLLLQVVKALGKDSPLLVMVGPRDLFALRLQQETKRLKISNQVKFLFDLNNAELAWLYQRALGLVLPSLAEGFGLPVLEAAYFACPLFLSDIAVFQEIAPVQAQFFNPNSVDSLSRLLHPITKRVESRPASAYWKQFSFAKMAKQTLAVYRQCL